MPAVIGIREGPHRSLDDGGGDEDGGLDGACVTGGRCRLGGGGLHKDVCKEK